jgi:serine/threonine protein kinase
MHVSKQIGPNTDFGSGQNFLVDASGHVKLTDFGLATGALNPQKIESMKHKVRTDVELEHGVV